MGARGVYDGTLQMFVEPPREADSRTLRFLRWLAERGELEHPVAGPPVAPPAPPMPSAATPSRAARR